MILKVDPLINPDSILVSGPDYIIDTLSGLETLTTDLGVISRSKVLAVDMKESKNLYFKQNKVKVSFDIEQFTEKTIQVPITISNLPENLTLQTFPPNIQLICQVGLSNYEKLQSNYFKAQVDFKEISQAVSDRLKVDLVKQPEFIRVVNFSPKTVEYLIEK
jgi:YbbR domain-containing protein